MYIGDNLTVGGAFSATGAITPAGLPGGAQTLAATGLTVGTAAQITNQVVFITTTTISTRGVKLPVITTALLGVPFYLLSVQTLNNKVYPNTGAHIGTAATNIAKALTGLKGDIFIAKDTTHWWTIVGA